MKKVFLILVLLLNAALMNGQTLSAARSTDWTLAGLRDTISPSNIILFTGDNTGATDVSSALQSAITTAPANSIVQLKAGDYKILDEIELNSFVTLRGMGAGKTTLNFNLGGAKKSCLVASGTEGPDLSMTIAADKEGFSVVLADASSINVGDYVRFVQDDADLVNDSWSERRTGQVSKVASKTGDTITLHSPLRMDFPLSRNPRVNRVSVVDNIGIECLTLNRVDQVAVSADRNKVSKIKYSRVVNSWIKGVESANCNYAHFEALYSANLLVSGCYFHDAFEYGTGGRAYGAMLHFATSESKVENTVFDNLRHAMIVQAGANGNVFAYNSSTMSKKEWLFGFLASEDMVCHGNYAYLNLFEGNVAEWAKVDYSHGDNGPFNTYFRNRTVGSGFSVTNGSVNNLNQNFVGNEGSKSFSGVSHQETLNSWQSAIGTLETSLAYSAKPDFLNESEFGKIGYGNFGISASNPAAERYTSGDYITASCGYYVWGGTSWCDNFVPDIDSENYNARIWDGSVCTVSANTKLKTVEIEPGGRLELSSSNTLDLDTICLKSNASSYSQFKGDASFPMIYEMTISNPGWHLVSVPLTSGTISQAEEELLINYAGNSNGASIYSWDAATAVYNPFLDNLENVSSRAFSVYVDDAFVKTGKGINQDGNLPVTLVFKGMSNNGVTVNSNMGYGTAINAIGDPNGWNLIFNPYPCSIDLDAVFGASEPHYQIGAHLYDADSDVFEIRTTTAVNNGNATAIAPGQSFFVKVDALADLSSGYYDFDNLVKTLATAPSLLKSNTPRFNLVLLKNREEHSNVIGYLDQTRAVRYLSEKDISGNWSDSTKAILAIARNGHDGTRLLSVSAIDYETEVLPVSLYAPESGSYSVRLFSNSTDKEIYLKNKRENSFQELKTEKKLYLEKGWTENKFELVFKDQKIRTKHMLSLYNYQDGVLSIQYSEDLRFISKVRISSVAGKQVFESDLFDSKGEHQFEIGFVSSGVYLLQILEFGEWKSAKFIIN